ncbi:hypothetical protein NLI96_g12225 [Meripilus lineatus]|uniref:Arrestin-like N-terminal domain-containing protein n=1 Tax=Meripilus lineatus TaxID=2056292 RepID=A0AAD5UUB8_9APHY|nr:hypothetical protein NLI96_g12225 [Physisporinus lineatus]
MSSSVITLRFEPTMRVSGEVLTGFVDLHFPQILEQDVTEIHVKLRGAVTSNVSRRRNKRTVTRREIIDIARINCSMWTKGSAYPTDSTNVLRLPFRIPLPQNAPPSCQYSGPRKTGEISYFVEVVGVRPSMFSMNIREKRSFNVVPRDPAGLLIRAALESGFVGPTKTITSDMHIRKGMWGKYSRVNMELTLPALPSFPLFTKIPFTLRIVTTSKEKKYHAKQEDHTVFPEPPRLPRNVSLTLKRTVTVTAQGWSSDGSETTAHLGGLGSAASTEGGNVEVAFDKKWVPSGVGKMGQWTQESIISSSFQLSATPTFNTLILSQSNFLRLKVDFPGAGNTLETDIPINISSGFEIPPATTL